MDKIEKALQKAREQRAASPGASQPTGAVAASKTSGPPAITGSQTRQVVVDDAELERNRIVARATRSDNADIFRILRTKVLQLMADSNLKTIAITSADYGDGKTTIAVNLALSLALDLKQTVLLVDLDLRNPDIHKMLGIEPDVGLSDYLLQDAPVPSCLVKPPIERVVVLPISQPIADSSEMLASPKMATLAHELKTRYSDRIVIYDMPPLLTQDDTIAFLPHVDGVLMVIREGVTTVDEVKHCLHLLEGTNLLGTVLNNSIG